jgi:acetoin utilization protein AcuC
MNTCVYLGDELASYNFGDDHPFGPQRQHVFERAFREQKLDQKVHLRAPVQASREVIELFHSAEYIDRVVRKSKLGVGFLDNGDTPAFIGVYKAASYVVGSVIDAAQRMLANEFNQAFIPIAGLHHAQRNQAAGFCVFNDCGVLIEYLKDKGLKKILYVDIDAHHGDGVFYSFVSDPALIFVDIHESGDTLYPGTGAAFEVGEGLAQGMKLNIAMPAQADDALFRDKWRLVDDFLQDLDAEFVVMQCGADSIAGDPITHLKYTPASHAHALQALKRYAKERCGGRLLALGGGGYNHNNIARTWTRLVAELVDGDD